MTETTPLEHSDDTDSPNASPEPTERDALGRLFQRSQRLRQADHYRAFLDFIARLSHYSPFNSALLHVQRPGAMYFATESQWRGRFGRHVKTGARPCVILQPFGPILFVFAAKDTKPGDDGTSLPERVTEPFAVDGSLDPATWRRAAAHCEDKERVKVEFNPEWPAHRAGSIASNGPRFDAPSRYTHVARLRGPDTTSFNGRSHENRSHQEDFHQRAPHREQACNNPVNGAGVRGGRVSSGVDTAEEQYAAFAHEMAHLFCGHLGSTETDWWPDRRSLTPAQREIEAESVAYLVCRRAGLHSLSERYLYRHISGAAAASESAHATHTDAGPSDVDSSDAVPSDADQPSSPSGERDTNLLPTIGIETVLKAVTYIEDMGTSGFESKRDFS
ncbi:hypothetical protein CRI93_14615 [Longimonas halophila]|uniref:IrrE N-terminal-like domain-containing protein n=1 Tax=Longimonas halophila TaxID=1469170 RepID=A0A2H3NHQ3_9BACT|nr:hypothetical protein [Longimonas halophila]PEN04739.1 hypothetical protein CRI93_14615 [Longimonas halophila]